MNNDENISTFQCFSCDGTLKPILMDYTDSMNTQISVPQVPMFQCDKCGDTVMGDEGNRKIDEILEKIRSNLANTTEDEMWNRIRNATDEEKAICLGVSPSLITSRQENQESSLRVPSCARLAWDEMEQGRTFNSVSELFRATTDDLAEADKFDMMVKIGRLETKLANAEQREKNWASIAKKLANIVEYIQDFFPTKEAEETLAELRKMEAVFDSK